MRVIDTFRTILSLVYSPCGRFLYSAGWQNVSRWDVFSGDELELYRDPSATYLLNVQVSPSGRCVGWEDLARQRIEYGFTPTAVLSRRQKVPKRIELNRPQTWAFQANDAHFMHTEPVAIDRSGRVVAYLAGARLHSTSLPLTGGDGPLLGTRDIAAVLNAPPELVSELPPDRFGFASAELLWWCRGDSLALLDMKTGEVGWLHGLDRPPLAVTPDGRTGIACTGREVLLIDLPSGLTRERFNWDVGTVEAVAVAPDGMTAAVAGWAGGIAIFDLDE